MYISIFDLPPPSYLDFRLSPDECGVDQLRTLVELVLVEDELAGGVAGELLDEHHAAAESAGFDR